MTASPLTRLVAQFRRPSVAPEPSSPPEPPAESLDSGRIGEIDQEMSGWFNKAADEAAPGFKISADDVVVDVGAGDGGLAGFCALRARETILIDHDRERLDRALQRYRAYGVARARAEVGDAAHVPLPDGYASRVICTEVLEHVDDPDKVMAELVRIGQPGALYLLSAPGTVSEKLQTKIRNQKKLMEDTVS